MRYSQLTKLLYAVIGLLLSGGVLAGLWIQVAFRPPPETEVPEDRIISESPPGADEWPGADVWAGPREVKGSEGISRYELAGTFQVFEGESERVASAAVVDDQETGVQTIVREGDELGMYTVGGISEDRLRLMWEGRTWVLALSGATVVRDVAREEPSVKPVDPLEMPALETSRFGKRIKENYWVLNKETLKGYIDEMMKPQNMLRTVNLYRSFSQVSEQGDEEPGFKIGMKAEKDFFRDMGLQDGDVIRRVNSMKMRTQRRAEYMLKEFYNDRMSAIVLDVERDGESRKHIYLVR